ncbi:MAG: deoxyribonuclease V [Chloroflexi bacterium]|nr:deoxyribonuclease V [Chloroflexota bacterium]
MQVQQLHSWQVSPAEAQAIQRRLAALVSQKQEISAPKCVAGVDISSRGSRGAGTAAVVVLSYPDLNVLEVQIAEREIDFPYVPGLLSFREAPLILAACQQLDTVPDLVIVDGQGIAHPRRFGLASHLGLLLDTATIGCAKSLLCGTHEIVEETAWSFAEIKHNGDVIGAALRTRPRVKPVYVSIGHKMDLSSAISWTMKCCRVYRLPEPTRLAHLAANGRLPLIEKSEHQ